MKTLIARAGAFLAGDLSARALAFVVLVVGARELGPHEFGSFALVYSVVGIALVVSDLGLTPLVLRRLSRPGRFSGRVLWGGVIANFAIGAVSYAAVVSGFALFSPRQIPVALVYAPVLVIQAVASSADAVLLSAGSAPRLGMIRTFGNAILLATAVAFLNINSSAVALAAAFAIGSSVKCGASVMSVRSIVERPRFSKRLTAAMLKKSLPFAGAAVASYLYFRIDVLLVAALASEATVGIYSAAYRFIDGLILVPGALAYVVFPHWMRHRNARASVAQMLRLVVTAGVIALVVGEATAAPAVHFLLGQSFTASAAVLQILLLGCPVLFADVVLVWLAYAYHRERGVVLIGLVALVANVGANVALVPYFGARGAAAATVASEIVNFAGYAVLFRRELAAARKTVAVLLARFTAVVGVVAPILLLQQFGVPRSVGAPLAVVVLSFAVRAFGLIRPSDLRSTNPAHVIPSPS